MFRIAACLIAILILTIHLQSTSGQPGTAPAAAPAAAPKAKPSRMKRTVEKNQGDEGQVERQQAQDEGLPQGGESQGLG